MMDKGELRKKSKGIGKRPPMGGRPGLSKAGSGGDAAGVASVECGHRERERVV